MKKKAEDANAYYNKQPEKMNTYDAGESVKNMPIKKTEESHKQCSPGEFGMNKEGKSASSLAHTLDAARRGANVGGVLGGLAGVVGGGIHGAYDPGAYGELDSQGNPVLKRRSRLMGALRGAAGYGLGGIFGGRVLGAAGGAANARGGGGVSGAQYPPKTASALEFGAKIAQSIDMPFTREGYNQVGAASAGGTLGFLGGGAAGAGLGALHGLISPGEQ